MTTRTQRLEAALWHFVNGYPNNEWRGLLHEEGCPGVLSRRNERDEEWPCRCDGDDAEDEVDAALADTAPSCCEEVRRAALEEAARVVEERTPDFIAEIDARFFSRLEASIRALSNQAPPKSLRDEGALNLRRKLSKGTVMGVSFRRKPLSRRTKRTETP